MPIYEYECSSCGNVSEVIQKFSDPPLEVCEECGGQLERLLSAPGLHFKGSGWYVTDYAKSGKTDPNGSSKPKPADTPKSKKSTDKASTTPAKTT